MIRREKKQTIKKIKEYEKNIEYWKDEVDKLTPYVNEMRKISGLFNENNPSIFLEIGEAELLRAKEEVMNHNRLINKLKKWSIKLDKLKL